MRLSVIIPAYNCEGSVGATLDSILAQTLPDFEVILVNDGSTDGTAAVLASYAKRDSRVRFLTVENGGPARARNLGISEATGDYLYFMDSDDLILPDMFETLLPLAEERQLDVVACGYTMDNLETKKPHIRTFGFDAFTALTAEDFRGRLTDLIRAHQMYVIWNKLYRTAMIRENGIEFPDFLSGEDRLFNTQTFPHIRRFAFVDRPFYRYFLRGQQTLANRYVANRFDAALRCHTELLAAYDAMGLATPETRSALDFAFVKGVMSCFTQLNAKGCPLRWKEKRAVIGEVLAHPLVQSAIRSNDSSFGYSKLVSGVLRSGNRTLIYLMAKAIFLLQFRLNNLYLNLKHRVKRS